MTEELEQPAENPEFAPEPVDEGAIRRKSMWSKAMSFAKNGMLVGAVGGLVMSGGMLGLAAMGVKLAATAATGMCGVPVVGWIGCGVGGAAAVGTVWQHIATNGLLGTGLQAMWAVGSVTMPMVLGGVALGGLIGMAWGAANGAADADKEIEKAEQVAKLDAHKREVEFHRRQYEKAQLAQMQTEFAQQGRDMGYEAGYLASPRTPAQGTPEQATAPILS
jgi:hypothetical protein